MRLGTFTFSQLRKHDKHRCREEITYRQSRLCRLLGNPVAFAVVALLTNGKDLSTSEIAKAIGRSVPRTSKILDALGLAKLARYETLWLGSSSNDKLRCGV
jgi:hypothetical protein